jgi:hypothetical protein
MAAFTVVSCSTGPITISGRIDNANTIAQSAKLVRKDIAASPFILASWQRVTDPSAPMNVYIEGDGSAWLNRTTPSLNPTPKNATALKLASIDPGPNVVYLARPCQFTDLGASGNDCRDYYWRGGRFSPEVINSFDQALEQISTLNNKSGFHLIGYSGGANIAGLIAERRVDILSIRTVAGNIDNDAFVGLHKVSTMPSSLNMADKGEKLLGLPQMHFIGGEDNIIPPSIFDNYRRKAGPSPCIFSQTISGISHENGWEERWPELLMVEFACGEQKMP